MLMTAAVALPALLGILAWRWQRDPFGLVLFGGTASCAAILSLFR